MDESNWRLRIMVEQGYDTSGTIKHAVKAGEITRESVDAEAALAYANYVETNNEMGAPEGWQDESDALTEANIRDYMLDLIEYGTEN